MCDFILFSILARHSFIHTGRVIKLISMIFRCPQPFRQESSTDPLWEVSNKCTTTITRSVHFSLGGRGGSLIDHTQMIWGEMKPIEPCVHFPMTSQAQIKNARNQRRQPFVLEKIQQYNVCFLFEFYFNPFLLFQSQPVKHASIMCHVTREGEREKMI